MFITLLGFAAHYGLYYTKNWLFFNKNLINNVKNEAEKAPTEKQKSKCKQQNDNAKYKMGIKPRIWQISTDLTTNTRFRRHRLTRIYPVR